MVTGFNHWYHVLARQRHGTRCSCESGVGLWTENPSILVDGVLKSDTDRSRQIRDAARCSSKCNPMHRMIWLRCTRRLVPRLRSSTALHDALHVITWVYLHPITKFWRENHNRRGDFHTLNWVPNRVDRAGDDDFVYKMCIMYI